MNRLVLITAILSFNLASAQQIHSGEDLLRAMHERYKNSWYQTVTFTQKSTTYHPDGTSTTETWYEAAAIPGKLRIDIGSPTTGNGYLFVNGDLSVVKDNKVTATQHSVNMLLVLGFDVYRQDPEITAKIVKAENYDLSKIHEDTWEGKPAYVVGATKGDLKSKQFWVEKNSLLFVRDIEPARKDPGKMEDIRFTNYGPLADAWIAAGVEVHSEGRKIFSEDYTDIRANVRLEDDVFDPQKFASTHWEK